MGCGKPRGINAGKKLKNKRRIQKWNDKDYRKRNSVQLWKKPFGNASHALGIVVEKLGVEAK